jgi:hypothetical protein
MRIDIPERVPDGRVALRPLRPDDAQSYAAAFRSDPMLGWLAGYDEDPNEDSVPTRVQPQGEWAEQGEALELAIAD